MKFFRKLRQDRAIRREREAAIRAKLLDAYKTIGDVEGWKLDAQQMECITKEARSHLVIAGAGTGKTTTIVGKIKYMLRKGTLRPENILVLSFTNASAKEMRERIAKETDERIEASTFHKLGLNIIKSVHGRAGMPGISEIDMEEFIKARIPEADEGTRKLVETIINLMKNNDWDIERTRKVLLQNDASVGILERVEPTLEDYQNELAKNDEIDFNDMINLATKYVREGKYLHEYKCVIVDEYQDISKSRFGLLKAMRDVRDYDLFAVGDDWQSIYRFAGSDIGFILEFEKYWGESEISKIETTYRSPQKLIDIAGSFIMENPNQVKKAIKSPHKTYDFPLMEICAVNDLKLQKFLIEELMELPEHSTVYFIGRYNFDIRLIKRNRSFEVDGEEVSFLGRPDLDIRFITAHRSKGLQADYVFIINNKEEAAAGFPSQIPDDPILGLLLENSDDFEFAEERRLFYVACTRAKKRVFLLTTKEKESVFVKELRRKYGGKMKRVLY